MSNEHSPGGSGQRAMEEKNYKIGELARLSGLTTRTLRYYEELKLIHSERTQGGQRVFDCRSLARLSIIESLKIAGFSLEEIRHILLDWKESTAGKEAAEKLLAILQTKHQEVSRTVSALNELKQQIESTIDMLDNCVACRQKPEPDLCGQCEAAQESGDPSPLIDEIRKR
ncbi:MAG: MerR family transcriptional regulator [Chitinivibrionia bacterium]|nr:MerR family transcriptional regulator [Chitinivibrionia bacterium]